MSITIPESHRDLLSGCVHAVMTTLEPDGQPQSSVIWIDYDGEYLLLSTAAERRKARNLQANPNVNIFVLDPENGERWLSVIGELLEATEEDAEVLADALTQRYSGGEKQHFYGDVYAVEKRKTETRVTLKIVPTKVYKDAIFKAD